MAMPGFDAVVCNRKSTRLKNYHRFKSFPSDTCTMHQKSTLAASWFLRMIQKIKGGLISLKKILFAIEEAFIFGESTLEQKQQGLKCIKEIIMLLEPTRLATFLSWSALFKKIVEAQDLTDHYFFAQCFSAVNNLDNFYYPYTGNLKEDGITTQKPADN